MRTDHEDSLLTRYLYQEDLYKQTDDDGLDIITLRYTLFQCRKQLLLSIQSLLATEFAYGKVELREDFDKLNSQCDSLKVEHEASKKNLKDLLGHCKTLVRQTNELLAERNDYCSAWEHAKDILTPRPDWDKCSRLVVDWKRVSTGKTSEELMEVVLSEILYGNTEENNEEYLPMVFSNIKEGISNQHFPGGLIKNRHLRRRMTGLLIRDIWSSKLHEENKDELKLTDYVFNYLTKRFDSQDTAIEIGSNLQDACHRYRHHYEINLFWQILTGQMEENIYHHEMKEFARILQHFIRVSAKTSAAPSSWTLPWSDLPRILHDLYPDWTTLRISLLMHAAERDAQLLFSTTDDLKFWLLFMEDDEGHVGEFLLTVRQLLQLDKVEYIEKIKDLLIEYPLVSINQFKQAVQYADPRIPQEELQRYVNWVYSSKNMVVTVHQQAKTVEREIRSRDFEEILLRLERCSCFMH